MAAGVQASSRLVSWGPLAPPVSCFPFLSLLSHALPVLVRLFLNLSFVASRVLLLLPGPPPERLYAGHLTSKANVAALLEAVMPAAAAAVSWMDGWPDGWMTGWVNGWMDEWDGWKGICTSLN